jgi:hypothetical protein
MKKISIKNLIEFRKKSEISKKTFIEKIKSNKIEQPADGGGDYWITSLSAVCNSYRQDNLSSVNEKIFELQDKLNDTKYTITKNMYQRNILNLQNYKAINLKKLRPIQKLSFLKKSTGNPLLTIKGLQIEAKPSHIFTFGDKDEEKVGAIWFVAKVNGYRLEEVGMFCDMLYRFLKHNYSKKYQLIPKYCIAVDMVSGHTVDYTKIEDETLSQILTSTLDEINKFM